MTSYDDDQQIDFKKLENELNVAAEADARYWRENDAKFRAVHQKVASYEEFKDIVKASHLKPLEKDDRLTNIKFIQPWNAQARKGGQETDRSSDTAIQQIGNDHLLVMTSHNTRFEDASVEGGSVPNNSQEFVRDWRKLGKVTEKQYKFLLDIGAEQLERIFKPEIGFGLLGEFAHCWQDCFSEDTLADVVAILCALSKTNRFSLTVQFLSSKEKQDLKDVFAKIRSCVENSKSGTDDEKEKNVHLEALEKVYEIKK